MLDAEPKSYVDQLHSEFAPLMDYDWEDLWDFIRATATTQEHWAEIAVIADLDISDVRKAIVEEKSLGTIDKITHSLGFTVGSRGTRTVKRFAAEKAVLARALQRRRQ